MPTSTVENYLKAIWSFQESLGRNELVSVGAVAEKLSVAPGTATTMMNQMKKQGLVVYVPRRGVRLNDEGARAALKVLRRHRLVETFLVEVMKLDWAEVHEDAEVLEHVVSDRLLDRMDEMLDHPTYDPHGAPIPGPDGQMVVDGAAVLADCGVGEYVVKSVCEDEPSFLQWLSGQRLLPGTRFLLTERDLQAGMLVLDVEGATELVRISLPSARFLRVVTA